jgi:hypothetical protein
VQETLDYSLKFHLDISHPDIFLKKEKKIKDRERKRSLINKPVFVF